MHDREDVERLLLLERLLRDLLPHPSLRRFFLLLLDLLRSPPLLLLTVKLLPLNLLNPFPLFPLVLLPFPPSLDVLDPRLFVRYPLLRRLTFQQLRSVGVLVNLPFRGEHPREDEARPQLCDLRGRDGPTAARDAEYGSIGGRELDEREFPKAFLRWRIWLEGRRGRRRRGHSSGRDVEEVLHAR